MNLSISYTTINVKSPFTTVKIRLANYNSTINSKTISSVGKRDSKRLDIYNIFNYFFIIFSIILQSFSKIFQFLSLIISIIRKCFVLQAFIDVQCWLNVIQRCWPLIFLVILQNCSKIFQFNSFIDVQCWLMCFTKLQSNISIFELNNEYCMKI